MMTGDEEQTSLKQVFKIENKIQNSKFLIKAPTLGFRPGAVLKQSTVEVMTVA
jgi:hypothetical protein